MNQSSRFAPSIFRQHKRGSPLPTAIRIFPAASTPPWQIAMLGSERTSAEQVLYPTHSMTGLGGQSSRWLTTPCSSPPQAMPCYCAIQSCSTTCPPQIPTPGKPGFSNPDRSGSSEPLAFRTPTPRGCTAPLGQSSSGHGAIKHAASRVGRSTPHPAGTADALHVRIICTGASSGQTAP